MNSVGGRKVSQLYNAGISESESEAMVNSVSILDALSVDCVFVLSESMLINGPAPNNDSRDYCEIIVVIATFFSTYEFW